VHLSGDKMSKSLGNLAFVEDLLQRHPPSALRAFLLRRQRRLDWEFHEQDLAAETGSHARPGNVDNTSFDADAERAAFFAALDEDLDTALAMRVLDRAKQHSSDPRGKALAEEGAALLGLDL
jgi:cysteinyl-tRNA synthetase